MLLLPWAPTRSNVKACAKFLETLKSCSGLDPRSKIAQRNMLGILIPCHPTSIAVFEQSANVATHFRDAQLGSPNVAQHLGQGHVAQHFHWTRKPEQQLQKRKLAMVAGGGGGVGFCFRMLANVLGIVWEMLGNMSIEPNAKKAMHQSFPAMVG